MTKGVTRTSTCSSQRPASVSNIAIAKKRDDNARLVAATSAPSVNTVQYTRKRANFGRAVGTRQMRLNVTSTLLKVISNETTNATMPAAVSCPAFAENWRR